MKNIKFFSLALLSLLLVSCGPTTSTNTNSNEKITENNTIKEVKDITLKDFKAIIDENDKVARNPTHFTGVGTSQNSEMISNGTLKSYTINDLSSYSEYSTTMTSRKTQDQSSFSYINACNIVKVDN